MKPDTPEAYSEPCQTSKMELFVKMINGWKPLTIFAKSSISDYCQCSEYASTLLLIFNQKVFQNDQNEVDVRYLTKLTCWLISFLLDLNSMFSTGILLTVTVSILSVCKVLSKGTL